MVNCALNLKNQKMMYVIESFVHWNDLLMANQTNAPQQGMFKYNWIYKQRDDTIFKHLLITMI